MSWVALMLKVSSIRASLLTALSGWVFSRIEIAWPLWATCSSPELSFWWGKKPNPLLLDFEFFIIISIMATCNHYSPFLLHHHEKSLSLLCAIRWLKTTKKFLLRLFLLKQNNSDLWASIVCSGPLIFSVPFSFLSTSVSVLTGKPTTGYGTPNAVLQEGFPSWLCS